MKLILFIALALACCTSVAAQDSSENFQLKEYIRRLDMAHAQAIFKGDAGALDSLMDDDVTVNHPTNRIVKEKKELLDLISQGVIRYSVFERTQETFLFYPGLVVVMGSETVVPAQGAPNAGKRMQRRYTNFWMKRDKGWRLTVRHANNVCVSEQ